MGKRDEEVVPETVCIRRRWEYTGIYSIVVRNKERDVHAPLLTTYNVLRSALRPSTHWLRFGGHVALGADGLFGHARVKASAVKVLVVSCRRRSTFEWGSNRHEVRGTAHQEYSGLACVEREGVEHGRTGE